MRKGDRKIFTTDEEKLSSLIGQAKFGWSSRGLADMFGCDRTSIKFQIRKHKIKKLKKPKSLKKFLSRLVRQIILEWKMKIPKEQDSKWIDTGNGRINAGKNYEDYKKR